MSDETTVLKGGISNIRYIWRTNGESCEACEALDGTEYNCVDEIPDKPHPNCNCYIEEVEENDDEDNSEIQALYDECVDLCGDYEGASGEGDNAIDEVQSIWGQIQSFASEKINELREFQDDINSMKDDACDEIEGIIDQIVGTIQIFHSNYNDLVSLREELGYYLDQSAEYYHTKANYDSAQLGEAGAQMAEMMGYLREYLDFIKEFIFKGYTLKDTFEHMIHDLEVNQKGMELGKEHPNETPEVIIPRPKGLPPDFW